MKIDETGILYALIKDSCDISSVVFDYFRLDTFMMNQGCDNQHSWVNDKTQVNGVPIGFARLSSGFIYSNCDGSIMIGFDGDKLNDDKVREILNDERFEACISWGDQPPPDNKLEFIKLSQG